MPADPTSEETNLILLLGLDPTRDWPPAEVREQTDKKRREWNSTSQQVGTRANEANRKRQMLTKLEPGVIYGNPAILASHIRGARAAFVQQRANAETQLREEIRFASVKGYLLPEEEQDLRVRYGSRLSPDEFENILRDVKVETPISRESISPTTLKQIDEALAALNEHSLFTFLGLSENAPRDQLLDAADAKYRTAQLHTGELKFAHEKNLAGYAKDIFADDTRRGHYTRHATEQRFIREVLGPYIQVCDVTKELALAQVEDLLDRAHKASWSDADAQQLLVTLARRKGWHIELPAPGRAAVYAALQQEVEALKQSLSESRVQKAEAEQATDRERKARAEAERKAEQARRETEQALRGQKDRQRQIADLERELKQAERRVKRTQSESAQERERQREEVSRLKAELDRKRVIMEEELHERVAEFGPKLATYVARKEFIAAQSILQSFLEVPAQWRDDERRIKESIAEATRLLEQAKRIEATDSFQAEQLLDEALAHCADLQEALDLRRRLAPAAPTDLRVDPDRQGVTLTWKPSPSPQIRYVIVRKVGSQPASNFDGERFGVLSATQWHDDSPPTACPIWYAVFAERDSAISASSAIIRQPLFFLPDVADLRCAVASGRITLLWRPPTGASAIVIVRREGTPPRGFDDGTRHELGVSGRFDDTSVRDGIRYFYRVYCEYLDATRAVHRSEGELIDAVPEFPPQEVPALEVRGSQGLLNHTVTLIAATPAHGELRVYRSDDAPDIPASRTVPVHALRSVVGRTGRPLADMRDTLFTATFTYYTPVILFHDTAFLGVPREYSYAPAPTSVHADSSDHTIIVRWKWPLGCESVEVWSALRGTPSQNARTELVPRPDPNASDPQLDLRPLLRGVYDIAVRAQYRLGGRSIVSEWTRVSAHLSGPLVIRYAVRTHARVFGKQYDIVLSASEPLLTPPPPFVVVQAEEHAPVGPSDGQTVPTAVPVRHNATTWVASLDGFVPHAHTLLAVFPAPSDQQTVRFEPESPAAQRVT